MVLTRIDLNHSESQQTFEDLVRPDAAANDKRLVVRRLASWLEAHASGVLNYTVDIDLNSGAVQATATITFTDTRPVAAETFTLCGTVFTARDSGASGNEFNTSATDGDVTAAACVVAINASATAKVTEAVVATSVASVVTITALIPGTLGNGLVLTEALANTTAVDFASGSEGTVTSLPLT